MKTSHSAAKYFTYVSAILTLFTSGSLLLGCIIKKEIPPSLPTYDANLLFTAEPLRIEGFRDSFSIVSKSIETADGHTFSRPYIYDNGMDMLNFALQDTFEAIANEYGNDCSVTYHIMFNDLGLLSLMVYINSAGTVDTRTLNFDSDGCELITISDCFGNGDETYRFTLPDMISNKVTQEGHTLIGYMPPIDDSQQFYFTSTGIVFYYREYELCTAEAGCPEVRFKLSEIADLLNEDALLLRLKG